MLRCDRGDESDVDDLGPGPAPAGVPQRVWNLSRPEGKTESKALGWYRGRHSGWIDAVLTLQEMGHPRIAKKLQKHFDLNDDGSLG